MFKVGKNIKAALFCTIIPVVLSFILKRYYLYTISDIIMFSLFSISILSIIWIGFGCFLYDKAAKVGHFLGKYLAIIALFFVYIFAVLPTGILMKIVKRDRLLLKQPDTQTYWKKYENINSDYEYQF